MGLVPANKNRKQRWIIMGVIIVIVFIIGCLTCLAIKRKLAQNAGVVDSMEREKQFKEFEKLFREQQDDLERLAEELLNSLEKKDYLILFDEESYSGNYGKGFIKLLYLDDTFQAEGNEDLVAILNENTALKKVLNSIIENGVISDIGARTSGDMWVLELPIDPKFTPFITGNNGVANAFHYCEEKGFEDGYYDKKVDGNWYLWISPAPE